MDIDDYAMEAKLFKTLNHPVRLAILEILREDEACVCHLEAFLKLRQAYISQQLMILRETGLVQDRRDGLNIYYRVSNPKIFGVIDAVSQITENSKARSRVKSRTKNSLATCDCPKCKNEAEAQLA